MMSKGIVKIFTTVILILSIICTSSIPGFIFDITKIEIVLCGLGMFAFLFNGKTKYSKNCFWGICIYLVFLSFLQYFLYPKELLHWLRLCLLFIVMIQISLLTINRSVNILKIFYYICLFLCVLSTTAYFMVEIFYFPLPSFIYSNDWLRDYNCYLYVYVSMIGESPEYFLGYELSRNCGIFSEPGLFSTFIIFSLFIYLFVKEKKNTLELSVLLISLLTTFSTTGFLLCMAMFAYYINRKKTNSAVVKLVLPILTILVVALLINNIMSAKQQEHAFSYAARTLDLIGGIELFLKSPLWGWGYMNHDAFSAVSLKALGSERSDSNGIVAALYQIGLIGTAIYYIPLIKMKKHFYENKKIYFLFIVVLIFSIMGEPIQYLAGGIAIFSYIIAYLLSSSKMSYNF